MSDLKSKKQQKTASKNSSVGNDVSVISLAWDLGWMIVVPIVVFATGGAFIDKSIGTSPWMLLGGIGLSLIITSVMVYGKVVKVFRALGGDS